MDPRVSRLIERYAYARGDLLLARKKGRQGPTRPPSPEVVAGWALERSRGEPLRAIELVRGLRRMPPWQRREVLGVLRPLTMVLDLTKPLIQPAGHLARTIRGDVVRRPVARRA